MLSGLIALITMTSSQGQLFVLVEVLIEVEAIVEMMDSAVIQVLRRWRMDAPKGPPRDLWFASLAYLVIAMFSFAPLQLVP